MKELTLAPHSTNAASFSLSEQIAWAKNRIDALDAFRIQKALENSDENFKQVFSLLALIIHYNSPLLPAYVENAPQGIFNFQSSSLQLSCIKEMPTLTPPIHPSFEGLYVMGSVGSITQTSLSDIDLWLCHTQNFTSNEQQLLQQKLAAIKLWAEKLGVEVNFYLMNPDEFRRKNYQSDIGDEHNGSAQHFFLLDEFYRSAIRLAGKRILWLHLESQNENYVQKVQQAVENGELNVKEWIDFGDFSSFSHNEFFGAALWQLYKGIKSPYKSAIKILLLESYTRTYPEIELISKKFKQLLLSHHGICYHFDPYRAMLDQVSHYLEEKGALGRLNFLRQCFYIKAKEGQKDQARLQSLRELSQRWNWNAQELLQLDHNRAWKIKQVAYQHKMIVGQLLLSYRNLLQFARKFQVDPSIMPQDTDFLMRQLYSAFERLPSKVELLNEKRKYNLAEEHLTFVKVAAGSSVKAGWYILNHAPFADYDSTSRYVHYEPNLVMATAWAYFNGLLTESSQIHLVNQGQELVSLQAFIDDLHNSFPAKSPKISREELDHPNEIRNLIVAINLTKDPTSHLKTLSHAEIEQLDLFNLSPSKQGIIGSISIIYRNMWNEIMACHFEGEGALLKALKLISNKIYLSSAPPQSVKVFSYSQKLTEELQDFVFSLVSRCITVKTGSIFQRYQPQIVQMAGKTWQLVFDKHQELRNIVEGENHQPYIPEEVFNFASEGFLQFFFDDNSCDSFNVYVLDKHNKVEYYHYCQGEKEDKIRIISRLHAENMKVQDQKESDLFNFPQFYQLLRKDGKILIVPFQSKQHRDFLDTHTTK